LPAHFEVVVVPACKPQTKPKALNYALSFSRGDLIAVYDAEDVPDPRQLRLAAGVFARAPEDLACVQARLDFFNAGDNWLTRGIMAQTPEELSPRIPRYGGWTVT